MTFSEVKNATGNFLDNALKPYETCDLNQRRYLGDIHKVASDFMYHLRVKNHIKDHQVNVRYIDLTNANAGFNIFIKFWLHDSDPAYQFRYVFDKGNHRLITAYDRAMSIV